MARTIQKLLFIDTNIWLDFYRARNDAGLALLKNVERVSDRIIVTYQLEIEFKNNRQAAIIEGQQELKAPLQIQRPGLFSDAQATRMLNKNIKEAEKSVKNLKNRLTRVLENPTAHDPVYQSCQRIFHRNDGLVLSRENKLRYAVRRKALRRFMHGCPPRKKNDTSIGDAFNWEWMIHCSIENNAELVIVSRDSDYGISFGNKAYVNDHLRQEFSERVSKKRKLLLYTRLADALKHFEIPISPQEEAAETEIVASIPDPPYLSNDQPKTLPTEAFPNFYTSTFDSPGYALSNMRLSESALETLSKLQSIKLSDGALETLSKLQSMKLSDDALEAIKKLESMRIPESALQFIKQLQSVELTENITRFLASTKVKRQP